MRSLIGTVSPGNGTLASVLLKVGLKRRFQLRRRGVS
jgi:hypothetical protein